MNLSSFRFGLLTIHHLGLEFLPPALELNHSQSLRDETLGINGRVQVDQSPQVPVPPLAPLARRAEEDSCATKQMVYNTIGLRVATLAHGFEGPGYKSVQFDARLPGEQAGDLDKTIKMLVIK